MLNFNSSTMDKLSQWTENSPAFTQVKSLVEEITSSNSNMVMFFAFVVLLVVQVKGFMVGFIYLLFPSCPFFMPFPELGCTG